MSVDKLTVPSNYNGGDVSAGTKTSRLRILMVINSLPMGGAEVFFTRLARGLSKNNFVAVFLFSPDGHDTSLMEQLKGIPIFWPPLSARFSFRIVYKASLLIEAWWPRLNLLDLLRNYSLRRLQARLKFDVCNPHLMFAERQVCLAFANRAIAIVGSDHGDYRWIISSSTGYSMEHFLSIFSRADGLICPSESNARICKRYERPTLFRDFVIYYGYDLPQRVKGRCADIKDEFIFGMVARGVSEKGWAQVLNAFIRLHLEVLSPIKLVLVGDGEHLHSLRMGVPPSIRQNIIFAGYQSNPERFVANFDVAMLPSYYVAESLPVSVIEYLAQGKPVIATDTGGICEMLETAYGPAGIIVAKDETGRADEAALCAAMRRMIEDPSFLSECQRRARLAFEKFALTRCVDAYVDAFRCVLHVRKSVCVANSTG